MIIKCHRIERVLLVGLYESLNKEFEFPEPITAKLTLKNVNGDLQEPLPAYEKIKPIPLMNYRYSKS